MIRYVLKEVLVLHSISPYRNGQDFGHTVCFSDIFIELILETPCNHRRKLGNSSTAHFLRWLHGKKTRTATQFHFMYHGVFVQ